MRSLVAALVLALGTGGCGRTASREGCDAPGVTNQVSDDARHLDGCQADCGNGLSPPTSGPHCAEVASCRAHTSPVPRCTWLHNLEHGHVAFLYNCPEGCPDLVAALEAERGKAPSPSRTLLTPDPALPTRAAVVAWGWSWSGDALDARGISCVRAQQDVLAPEPGVGCAP